MKRRRKRKSWAGKVILSMFLIGIISWLIFIFSEEIINLFSPFLERWNILEKRREIILYFSDMDGEFLVGERRRIMKRDETKEEAKETIIELIKGPKGKLIPTLPVRTKCLNLKIDDNGIAIVNFNRALIKDHPGGSTGEIMTTYSIVNSLVINFPQIKKVQILIEGRPIETISGHISLRQPIPYNPDLIKRR